MILLSNLFLYGDGQLQKLDASEIYVFYRDSVVTYLITF